jgi:hypothetical protein
VRFWDASALLSLAVREEASERVEKLLQRDSEVVLWWGTAIDCTGALYAAVRQGRLASDELPKARNVLDHLCQRAFEIQAHEEVRARALRVLAVHPLPARTALELAAALIWCRERTQGVGFVSLEGDLRYAAGLEGFRVLPYPGEVHDESEGG